MAWHTRPALALAGVLLVSAVPGFAQTNTGLALDAVSAAATGLRVYAAARSAAYDEVPAAGNITIADPYRSVVRAMLERSPTFRRQWARLARATQLTVDVRSEPGGDPGVAAYSTIRRELGVPVAARVIIIQGSRTAELIAHELEHVIEQLDGIDLTGKANVRGSGVRHCACGEGTAYETTRAIETGLRVAEDLGERRR